MTDVLATAPAPAKPSSPAGTKSPSRPPPEAQENKPVRAAVKAPTKPVKYYPCRTPVYPPAGFDRSAPSAPRESLELEWVHGYAGLRNTANNLECLADGTAVYYTAGVGVVYDAAAHAQRFFVGHDDDVTCLALDSSRDYVATGQVGREAWVCVWQASSMQELARLSHVGVRGVAAVGFSASGRLLASVGLDDAHTVHVWDWRSSPPKLIHTVPGGRDEVWGLKWCPRGGAVQRAQLGEAAAAAAAARGAFVTFGRNHVKLWSSGGGGWESKLLRFEAAPVSDVLCVEFLPGGALATGSPGGALLLWRGKRCVCAVRAHGSELRAMASRDGGRELLTGGGDGAVRVWEAAALAAAAERAEVSGGGGAVEVAARGELRFGEARKRGGAGGVCARALAAVPGGDVLVGTSECDVVMLGGGGERRVLVDGHTADLYGVARSAASAELFATACDSSRLKLWDAVARRALCEVPVGAAARCVAFSADGVWLAAGLVDGTVEVLRVGGGGAAVAASRMTRLREGDREVSALGFSPDGGTLAVGTAEGVVGLFDTATWRRLARCTGHATTVAHVDWSRDSSTVQTNCRGYEILYWEGRSGRQLLGAQRDWEAWEGWSCVLGWPVMGIWRDGYDGTDINAVHASDDGRLLVAADDRGGVLLYRFPCAARRAPCRRFRAHSSHVMNVRWLAGGDRCVSVGGRDRAVVQWRLAREAAKED